MPRLIVLQQGGVARQLTMRQLPYTVGRAPTCALVIDNELVSRTHAVFELHDDQIHLRDLGGANGTRVNGARIKSCVVKNGDEIKIGNCLIRFLTTGGQTLSDAEALRLVTVAGKLEDAELRKLARPAQPKPPQPRP